MIRRQFSGQRAGNIGEQQCGVYSQPWFEVLPEMIAWEILNPRAAKPQSKQGQGNGDKGILQNHQ
jgi:hypothetical protein